MADLILDGASGRHRRTALSGKVPAFQVGGLRKPRTISQLRGGGWLYFTAALPATAPAKPWGHRDLQDFTERGAPKSPWRERRTLSHVERHRRLDRAVQFAPLLRTPPRRGRARPALRPAACSSSSTPTISSASTTPTAISRGPRPQVLAGVISHSLRRTDSAFRYGGEEFAIPSCRRPKWRRR